MLIQITAGTFGHRQGSRVVAVKAGDPPIEVDNKVAENLIRNKVAIAVEVQAEQTKEVEAETEEENDFPQYDKSMTRAQLEKIAISVGIEKSELKKCAVKDDVIELLDSVKNEHENEPTFDVAGDML